MVRLPCAILQVVNFLACGSLILAFLSPGPLVLAHTPLDGLRCIPA